jgi:hypothetical protein
MASPAKKEESTELRRCLNKDEAARFLGVTRRLLSDLIRTKRIPTVRVSSAVVLLEIKELDKFIADHATYEVPAPPHIPKRKAVKPLVKTRSKRTKALKL